jgi:hypothetical protein
MLWPGRSSPLVAHDGEVDGEGVARIRGGRVKSLLPTGSGGCGLAGGSGEAEGGQARRRRWAPCLSFPCVHPVSPSPAALLSFSHGTGRSSCEFGAKKSSARDPSPPSPREDEAVQRMASRRLGLRQRDGGVASPGNAKPVGMQTRVLFAKLHLYRRG